MGSPSPLVGEGWGGGCRPLVAGGSPPFLSFPRKGGRDARRRHAHRPPSKAPSPPHPAVIAVPGASEGDREDEDDPQEDDDAEADRRAVIAAAIAVPAAAAEQQDDDED